MCVLKKISVMRKKNWMKNVKNIESCLDCVRIDRGKEKKERKRNLIVINSAKPNKNNQKRGRL